MAVPLSMTLLSFDMNQPINQAHILERKAEEQLKEGNWDDAVQNFNAAAVFMRKAMENVSSPKVVLPLRLQAEKFENMKNVIDIKRQESRSIVMGSPEKSLTTTKSSPRTNEIKKHSDNSLQKQKTGEVTLDKCTETLTIPKSKPEPSKYDTHSIANTWQHLTYTVERDSMMQFLNFPLEDELSTSTRKKKPKDKDTIIEEYKTRFNTLRNVAFELVDALDKSENENKSLRLNVEEQRSEIAILNERLMYFEENRKYIHDECSDGPQSNFVTRQFNNGDEMTVSMLINQPESYFKFEKKDIALEIEQAIKEDFPFDKKFRSSPPQKIKPENPPHVDWHQSLAMTDSIKYEELDDGTNTEVSQIVSNLLNDTNSYPSVAGLPPLSPVHFEPAEDFFR